MRQVESARLRHIYKFGPYQTGSVTVEMALIAVVMFLIAAGLVEFSRAFWYYNALDKATRNAARFMSEVPRVEITNSAAAANAVTTAKNIALIIANGANVTPPLTAANIEIKCDAAECNGTKPTNITVTIVSFSVTLGSLFPLVSVSSGGYGVKVLSPATTMPYLN